MNQSEWRGRFENNRQDFLTLEQQVVSSIKHAPYERNASTLDSFPFYVPQIHPFLRKEPDHTPTIIRCHISFSVQKKKE